MTGSFAPRPIAPVLPRVVIADTHPATRRALVKVIVLLAIGQVVGTAADMRTAGGLARRQDADVLLVDADLLAEERHGLGPVPVALKVVALGLERHPGAAARAVRNGAHAYVVKDDACDRLGEALAAIVRPSGARRRPAPGAPASPR
jgi:DNA-binding NarL/FixJ family response regulator